MLAHSKRGSLPEQAERLAAIATTA